VAKRPEHCPHCDFHIAPFLPPEKANSERLTRLRALLIGGAILSVAVGIFARELGSGGSSGPNRLLAKNLAGEGLEALMAGDYPKARGKLDLALKEDELFAEAYLGRAMTGLAVGDFPGADKDAKFAAMLFTDGRIEPRAWGETDAVAAAADGVLIAKRIRCVVESGKKREMAAGQASRLYQLFHALRRVESCADAGRILSDWRRHTDAHAVMVEAIGSCQELWPCQARTPAPPG
jgi:hypothetical protein